jgi:hypothetical protein
MCEHAELSHRRLAFGIFRIRRFTHINRIVVDLNDVNGFAGPWILPGFQYFAGLRIHVEHDFARDRAITHPTHGIVEELAGPYVHALHVKQVTIFLARATAVGFAFPPMNDGRAFNRSTRTFHGGFEHVVRIGEIVLFLSRCRARKSQSGQNGAGDHELTNHGDYSPALALVPAAARLASICFFM